jgi:PAS domain S-box-containing protein
MWIELSQFLEIRLGVLMGLKFFHRALILVAVPLVFELLFSISLIYMLRQVEAEARREEHIKQICITMSRLEDTFIDSTGLIVTAMLRGDAQALERFQEISGNVPSDLARLRVLMAASPADLEMIDKLEKQSAFAMTHLQSALKRLDDGDRTASILQLRQLQPLIDVASEELGEMRRRGLLAIKDSPEFQSKIRQQMKLLLLTGIGFNILIAVLLAVHFNRTITNRLSTLINNSRRLATGEELLSPVGGGDEIGHLDKLFHEMAVHLNQTHETERLILESIPLGLVTTDVDGRICTGNQTFYEMFEYSRSETEGRDISILFPGLQHFEPEASLKELVESASGGAYEREGMRKSGAIFPLELSLTNFQTSVGTRNLVVISDITQRKELERMKQHLNSTVSRDLRNPLVKIDSFLLRAADGALCKLDERGQKMASMAVRNSSRLVNLVNDLLSIEHSKSGSFALNKESADLSQLIERSVESVRAFAEKQGIDFEFDLSQPREIFADGDRLVQVMVNLLGNAVKFSPAGSTIKIVVEELVDSVVVKIIDQGRGVPAHLRDSIFQRFKQVKSTDATEAKGTGLGLAVCKSLIEQHGGSIGVESEESKGSTFWFRLPLDGPKAFQASLPVIELNG